MIFNRIYSDIIDKPIDQQAPVISREKAIYSQRKGNKYWNVEMSSNNGIHLANEGSEIERKRDKKETESTWLAKKFVRIM